MRNVFFFLVLLVLNMSLWSCESSSAQQTASVAQVTKVASQVERKLPTRRDLRSVFHTKRVIQFVYGSQLPAFAEQNKQLAELNRDRLQGFEVRICSDQEISLDSASKLPLVLLGSPASHSFIHKIQHQLPLSWDEGCLYFDDGEWCDSTTVFSLGFYPNPQQTQNPLLLVTAEDDQAIYNLFTQIEQWDHILWDGWDYKIYQQNSKRLIGKFNHNSDWQVNHADQFRFSEDKSSLQVGKVYEIIDHESGLSAEAIQDILLTREARAVEIKDFCGFKDDLPKIRYHLYPSTERKGLVLNNTDQIHLNFRKNEAYAVHNAEFEHTPYELDNELLIRHMMNPTRFTCLQRGLGIYLSENWQGAGYVRWAKLLHESDNMVPLSELLDNSLFAKESEYVMSALAASFVDFLLNEAWGEQTFKQKYNGWQPDKAEVQQLDKAWNAYLAKQPSANFPKRQFQQQACFRGFNFTHEGYQIYNGYISQKATESLEHLAGMDVNAVAIVPYTGMRDHTKPSFLPITNSPGAENDESVVHSLHEAKRLGMTTLLKPQVWLWSSWPGDVRMENEEDWAQFFDYYYRWIRHYALLGEIRQADIFCLGVEFQHATLSHEQEWREILRKIRGLFQGPITYAANWGDEFEKIGLWDELDYIAINCYYPLSKKENPSDAELKAGCQQVVQKIEKVVKKYQKPVLFTEIGFRSVEAPWQQPHEEAGDKAYNAEHQARAYRITCQSLSKKPWCRGLFWWKWPTIMTNNGDKDRRFIPYNKPAEEVIKAFYADWE